MPPWTEIRKLAQLLQDAGIPFEWLEYNVHGACLKIPSCAAWIDGGARAEPVTSVAQSRYTYGGCDGMLEIWTRGGTHGAGTGCDVTGWLTADRALREIRKEHGYELD